MEEYDKMEKIQEYMTESQRVGYNEALVFA